MRKADVVTADSADPSTLPVRAAYAHCRAIAHEHGANFSVGFRFLPRAKRDAVYATYAFCRHADDIADEPGSDILPRLDEWQEELDRCYAGAPAHPITLALSDALRRFDIPKQAFIDLIDGCRQDVVKTRYATFDELLHYCHLVATSISSMSLAIFGYRNQAALEHGRALATALQLTNVTRDIGDDVPRDRIYIPATELAQFGVSEDDVLTLRATPQMAALIAFQIERAEGYFRSAEALLAELSADARFPTQLMGSVYVAVLRKLRKAPLNALGPRLRLSTAEKIGVVLRALPRRGFF
jgi:15-cis-phytoene synthase